MDAWRWLVCPHCKVRLDMKPPRSFVLGSLVVPLLLLARRGHVFEVIAFLFMFATFFLLLLESVHPRVQLRKKPLPKPAVRLDIDGPSR
jgi:hypothetical protein